MVETKNEGGEVHRRAVVAVLIRDLHRPHILQRAGLPIGHHRLTVRSLLILANRTIVINDAVEAEEGEGEGDRTVPEVVVGDRLLVLVERAARGVVLGRARENEVTTGEGKRGRDHRQGLSHRRKIKKKAVLERINKPYQPRLIRNGRDRNTGRDRDQDPIPLLLA